MTDPAAQHQILSELKRLASELGHAPSKREWMAHSQISINQVVRHFGLFSAAVSAAGFTPNAECKPRKLSREDLFGAPIDKCLVEYRDKPAKPRLTRTIERERILVVGDTHFPFVNVDTLTALYQFTEAARPTVIVQVGDLYDCFSQGRFPRSRNVYNPFEEIKLGFEMARAFWERIKSVAPGAKCYQLRGNHDERPLKRVLEAAPDLEPFFSIAPYFQFTGVESIDDYRQELVLADIVFHHGYRSQLGSHRDYNLMNSVCGHSHKGGVVYRPYRDRILWELNAGFVGDPESKALSYTPQKITNWTQGWGFIDEWGPRFVPV